MEKEEFFLKRIRELANLSYQRDIVTFSDFLNLNEQNMVNSLKQQFPQVLSWKVLAAMRMQSVRWWHFILMLFAFTWEYPVDCLKIRAKSFEIFRGISLIEIIWVHF